MAGKLETEKKRKGHPEILGLDFGHAGLKVVRIRRNREESVVVGVELLPALALDAAAPGERPRLAVPVPLAAKYAAAVSSTARTQVRLITLPAHNPEGPSQSVESQIQKQFAVGDGFRLSFLQLTPPTAKGPARVVAVAMPEEEIQAGLQAAATGSPALHSFEVSGLAAVNAFLLGSGSASPEETVCLVEGGAGSAYVFFVHRGNVVLLRKYETGTERLVLSVSESLGVDREMAQGILSEGAIDVMAVVQECMGAVFKQLCISRDFVERQENAPVSRIVVTGGLALSGVWRRALHEASGLPVEPWNPFGKLDVAPGAYPESLKGQEPRFAAAVGAALGVWHAS